MAGNKMNNNKGKGKDEKLSKGVTQMSEDNDDLDFSLLRKPILTSITGFAQARKIFDLATEEVKDLLANECDLLYECKVCRNMFRSLANFISHKRSYCKDKFTSTVHGDFLKKTSMYKELLRIKATEKEYQESLKGKPVEDEYDDPIPLSKDLTEVVEKVTKVKGNSTITNETPQVVTQKISGSNVAVFQSLDRGEEGRMDMMKAQILEIDNILSRNKAVLQKDGKCIVERSDSKDTQDLDNVIQISDDEENDSGAVLKCKICDLQFSTLKTLKFHMKYKHLESRLVYPCPDCLEIFSTSWSVYRHLFKVHRKTAAQIRRLRESIQSKAFKMNNPPAYFKKKSTIKPVTTQKITEEERLDQENQAWMDNMEGDGEVPRCGGCGRTFPRRAALTAHTHTCQSRVRALAGLAPNSINRRADGKRIEIQIRKDYNKTVTGLTIHKANDKTETLAREEEISEDPEAHVTEEGDTKEETDDAKILEEDPMDMDDDKSRDSSESPEKIPAANVPIVAPPTFRLQYAMNAEKSNLAAFTQRVNSEIDLTRLLCKKCNTKYETSVELYEHMAADFKWIRYACKLCSFKHYNFDKILEHIRVVHKLKGDSDFYNSTIKAIDGTEATIISRCLTESENADENTNETSPESRRPSRCSSDSSRLSDDSSSSNTIKENGMRKRKMYQNKVNPKRRREAVTNDEGVEKDGVPLDRVLKSIIGIKETTPNKIFEETSSDMDDVEEKINKRHSIESLPTITSSRPVRKKTRPKNEDFEYDLSNLLKMEAQGYRESQSVTVAKTTQTKKKEPPPKIQETPSVSPTITALKDCIGALMTLSKKSVEANIAHMRPVGLGVFTIPKERTKPFARLTQPKHTYRNEKVSPKKDIVEEPKDNVSKPNKNTKTIEAEKDDSKKVEEDTSKVPYTRKPEASPTDEISDTDKDVQIKEEKDTDSTSKEKDSTSKETDSTSKETDSTSKGTDSTSKGTDSTSKETDNTSKETDSTSKETDSTSKESNNVIEPTGDISSGAKGIQCINSSIPLKFRRQSLELMKNPIINKNITDFKKAGMKTKILVIKPINRNKDGKQSVSTQLKFQTIKLKEKGSEDNPNDNQVMVVKVPKINGNSSPPTVLKPEIKEAKDEKIVTTEINNQDKEVLKTEESKSCVSEETEIIESDVKEKVSDTSLEKETNPEAQNSDEKST